MNCIQLTLIFGKYILLQQIIGVILGQKDLNFLGQSYGTFFFLVPYFMLRVKKAALQGAKDVSLTNLWSVFFVYNVARAAMWLIRTKMLSDKAFKEAEKIA